MAEQLLVGLASIIVLGILAQWLAWRLQLPSILLLLIFGFIAGPITGFLDPDRLLGDLLIPLVSVSVAIILFEGGLSLRISELREIGSVVRNLISFGALVTWFVSALSAHLILKLDIDLSILLGAILVVTGPTVIIPLLRHVRTIGNVGSILRWEGILIDPIGAMLAVLVFEAILTGTFQKATTLAMMGFFKTVLAGGGVGVLGAGFLVLLLRRYWIPDFLQNAVSLTVVVSVFAVSNIIQAESGLLAATVMGVALANQRIVTVKHIIEFKESLRVLLISGLFILLASRLKFTDFTMIGINSFVFLGVLVVIARPLAVAVSTIKSGLNWREKLFLSWMAPRGIVAAAVASIFALDMVKAGNPQAERLVPLTFMVIIGTVALYGLTASPIARLFKISQSNPQGVVIAGAHSWARSLAKALQDNGVQVLIVDTNRENILEARMTGIPSFLGNILSREVLEEVEVNGFVRLLALTSNDEVNSLAAIHFAGFLDRKEIFQLSPRSKEKKGRGVVPREMRGRLAFGLEVTFAHLAKRFSQGAVIKTTRLTQEFDFDAFQFLYGMSAIPFFLISETGELVVSTVNIPLTPKPGQLLISLVDPLKEPTLPEPQKGTQSDRGENV
jgi:NhaP-type Na+/H+ or K+/H+ antiporter